MLLNRINKKQVTVAVDGSLYRFHPRFHDLMTHKIGQLVPSNIKVRTITRFITRGMSVKTFLDNLKQKLIIHKGMSRQLDFLLIYRTFKSTYNSPIVQ